MTVRSKSKMLALLLIGAAAATVSDLANIIIWDADIAAKIAAFRNGSINPYREFNQIVNAIFFDFVNLSYLPALLSVNMGDDVGYYFTTYLRDLVLGTLLYWVAAGLWHISIYGIQGKKLFIDKGRAFPSTSTIIDQMQMAQSSVFIYAGLPVLSEFLIENKITKCYFFIEEIGGWYWYGLNVLVYLVLVEIGIYWMHRTLHTNKFLYKYVHAQHHKYNSPQTLTPWASIAFNPLDGILQASPYVLTMFFLPMHYLTHIFMLFLTGVWATNIHDALAGDIEPIMGAKYHTIHHTHYVYNYGQFFVFCDYFWGTLKTPEEISASASRKRN